MIDPIRDISLSRFYDSAMVRLWYESRIDQSL
jgi:hypothetical protein